VGNDTICRYVDRRDRHMINDERQPPTNFPHEMEEESDTDSGQVGEPASAETDGHNMLCHYKNDTDSGRVS
jgi:hypothetical protein